MEKSSGMLGDRRTPDLLPSATTTAAPSVNEDVLEKAPVDGSSTDDEVTVPVDHEKNGAAPTEEKEEAVAEEEVVYPTGIRLTFIVVALVLSIFLVALDMVSRTL